MTITLSERRPKKVELIRKGAREGEREGERERRKGFLAAALSAAKAPWGKTKDSSHP